jgi:hypothetical protein
MTDLKKAAQQALEALEMNYKLINGEGSYFGLEGAMDGYYSGCFDIDGTNKLTNKTMTALRAALAQEEQEPVAWRTFDGEGGYDYRTYDDNENYRDEWDRRNPNHKGWVEPLYTHPPRREWQSLSEEEINETLDNNLEGGTSLFDICRAIEQALKEKNHDVL